MTDNLFTNDNLQINQIDISDEKVPHPDAPRQYLGEPNDEYAKRLEKFHTGQKKTSTAQATLEELFDQIEPGMKCIISRKSPAWCEGHLETIEFDEDDIDQAWDLCGPEYLKATWGGERFRLQFYDPSVRKYVFSKVVTLRGIPPLNAGVPMESPAEKELRLRKIEEKSLANNKGSETMQQMFGMMFEQLNRSAKDSINAIQKTIETQTAASQSQSPIGQMEQTLGLLQMFEKMRSPAPQPERGDELTGMVKDLMGTFGGVLAKSQQQQSKQPTMPPMGQVPNTAQKPNKNIAHSAKTNDNSDDSVTLDGDDLRDQLVNMDNDSLAELLADTMDCIGEERNAQIFAKFSQLTDETE